MKVISISTFVALAALVHSSSALWCDCYTRTKAFGNLSAFDQYSSDLSQKCCKDVMNADLMTGFFSNGYCDAGSKAEEYKKCCAPTKQSYGYCK